MMLPVTPQIFNRIQLALAIRLTDAGLGDYWKDVDQYVRNHLVEAQLVSLELLKETSELGPADEVKTSQETADRTVERCVGIYCADASVTAIPNTTSIGCCTGNGTQALYYAWDGAVQVNLLLNRASSWIDIDSYLPYQGKAILKNKTTERISVRIPTWADRQAVQPRTIEFPMVETTEKYCGGPVTSRSRTAICFFFKCNTVVDVSPRQGKPAYPIYLRDRFKQNSAPLKKATRFASNTVIPWSVRLRSCFENGGSQ